MVRCSECGFLASRNIQTRQLEETEQEIRDNGLIFAAYNVAKPTDVYEPPICFMRFPDYKAVPFSFRNMPTTDSEEAKAVRAEIQRERNCDLFTPWIQGFTPQEHREMLDRQFQLEQEDKRRRSDRKWHFVELAITLIVGAVIAIVSAKIG